MVGYTSIKTADMDNSFNLFIELFQGKKITNQAQISIFSQGQNLEYQIRTCEKEWKRLGYKDERA